MHFPAHDGKRYDHEEHHYVIPHHDHHHSYHPRSIYHETHHELDHKYDDQHDIEPVHFHEHAIHRAFDHPDSHSYHAQDFQHDSKFSDLGYLHESDEHHEAHHHIVEGPLHFEVDVLDSAPHEHQLSYEVDASHFEIDHPEHYYETYGDHDSHYEYGSSVYEEDPEHDVKFVDLDAKDE